MFLNAVAVLALETFDADLAIVALVAFFSVLDALAPVAVRSLLAASLAVFGALASAGDVGDAAFAVLAEVGVLALLAGFGAAVADGLQLHALLVLACVAIGALLVAVARVALGRGCDEADGDGREEDE